jgi:hypothetical protein
MRIYAYAATLLLILAGVWYYGHTRYEAGRAKDQAEVVAVKAANVANLATIKALQAANAEWASKCAANQPKAQEQAQLSAQVDVKRQAAAVQSIKSLKATYEHEPTVKAWADTRVPDAVVRMFEAVGTH